MDYLRYWSLSEKPFAHDASQRFFCGTPQKEFLAGLNYLVTHERGAAFMATCAGCGATSLLHHVAGSSGLDDDAVEILLTDGGAANEQAAQIELAGALGLPMDCDGLSETIPATIRATARQAVRTVWLIDDCDIPAARLAWQLSANLPSLSIVLVSEVNAADRIARYVDPKAMLWELGSLSLDDTVQYVHQSLRMVGGDESCWSDEAIVRVHELGQGRLADMSGIAEASMALAARHQLDQVVSEIVEATQECLLRAA